MSQADLWLRGDLHIDQSFGASVPWPLARWTFTPLGYRPEPDGYRIVPQYAPGLPLLMAAFKAVAGQCAMFWVVPLCGGMLVFATYAIGRLVGRPVVGLAAAWIVATSPTVLFMLMAPMSDVPAAAAWAASVAFAAGGCTGGSGHRRGQRRSSFVRISRRWPRSSSCGSAWRASLRERALRFLLPAAAGAIGVAVVNARLYGSPFASGYDLTDGFMLSLHPARTSSVTDRGSSRRRRRSRSPGS